ncbi:MAG: ribonuclease E activity regulator RraA, partial [Candidatus Thioglobus sp.]|nr:ribonuclease E activity regulator RraA [Candidatus Thioglobus sp.]
IHTIKCFEDNSLVREVLDTNGQGRVLVVDAGGSKRCAMLGDQLAAKAVKNNWSGVIIYGLIRDSEMINEMPIGVRALGTHPLKSIKKGLGEVGLTLCFSGVNFIPGDYLYADQDGIIVVKELVSC